MSIPLSTVWQIISIFIRTVISCTCVEISIKCNNNNRIINQYYFGIRARRVWYMYLTIHTHEHFKLEFIDPIWIKLKFEKKRMSLISFIFLFCISHQNISFCLRLLRRGFENWTQIEMINKIWKNKEICVHGSFFFNTTKDSVHFLKERILFWDLKLEASTFDWWNLILKR